MLERQSTRCSIVRDLIRKSTSCTRTDAFPTRADLDFEEFLSNTDQLMDGAQADAVDDTPTVVNDTILETEFSHSFSTDALADELVEAIKLRLSEIQQTRQTGVQSGQISSSRDSLVRFWWCCDGTTSAGCPTSRDAPVSCANRPHRHDRAVLCDCLARTSLIVRGLIADS